MKRSCVLVALIATTAASPAAATDLDAVRKLVSDSGAAAAPGCAVGAFKAGKPLFVTASGMADVEANLLPAAKATLDDLVWWANATKAARG